MKQNEFFLEIAENTVRVAADRPLTASDSLIPLMCTNKACAYTILVAEAPGPIDTLLPAEQSFCGEDAMIRYYQTEDALIGVARKGTKGPVSAAVCAPDLHEITLYVNESEHPGAVVKLEKVLQLIPTRRLLMSMDLILLHSSRVRISGKAILFSAASGVGKTTQAGLWKQFKNADICSNDRTLIRPSDEICSTYSYPDDGSIPVYTKEPVPLGAIVVLRQEKSNRVQRLTVFQAMKYLLAQSVIDTWDGAARRKIQELWFSVLRKTPVYLLGCTADERAVECLHNQLEKDGVL